MGGLEQKVQADDLQRRVLREHEMRSSGQIQFTKGLYAGETDFGYLSGDGQFYLRRERHIQESGSRIS